MFVCVQANRRVKRENETVDKNWGLEKKIIQLQKRLTAKELENNFLKNISDNKQTEKPRNGLERSSSVRYPRPCVPTVSLVVVVVVVVLLLLFRKGMPVR